MEDVPEHGEEQNKLDKVEEWQTEQYVQRIQRNRKELYVACEENCWRVSGRQNSSGSAGVMQLPRGGCHSSTATCKVVMTQWWSVQKIAMCFYRFWPFPVPLIPVSSRNAVLRHAQG